MANRVDLNSRRWRAVRADVIARDQHCTSCGSTDDLEVDHVFPVARFTDEQWAAEQHLNPDYLTTLCRSCNASKGARLGARINYFNPRFLDRL